MTNATRSRSIWPTTRAHRRDERRHAAVWPAIEQPARRRHRAAEIYRTGNRLFMVMEVSPAFSFETKSAADARTQRSRSGKRLMTYQRALPWAKPVEKVVLMWCIYQLGGEG